MQNNNGYRPLEAKEILAAAGMPVISMSIFPEAAAEHIVRTVFQRADDRETYFSSIKNLEAQLDLIGRNSTLKTEQRAAAQTAYWIAIQTLGKPGSLQCFEFLQREKGRFDSCSLDEIVGGGIMIKPAFHFLRHPKEHEILDIRLEGSEDYRRMHFLLTRLAIYALEHAQPGAKVYGKIAFLHTEKEGFKVEDANLHGRNKLQISRLVQELQYLQPFPEEAARA
jgi:hypothetical protein